MEVAVRKKRASTTASTGLPNHSSASSSTVGNGSSNELLSMGLSSSSTRRSFGLNQQRLSALSMYNDAPQEEITLDQFERAGVDRLQGQTHTIHSLTLTHIRQSNFDASCR